MIEWLTDGFVLKPEILQYNWLVGISASDQINNFNRYWFYFYGFIMRDLFKNWDVDRITFGLDSTSINVNY